MILSPFEWTIAKRYLLPGKSEAFIALVASISIGVVMLSVAMLVVVMSVMNFVNHRTTGHEQHSFSHGVVEQVEQSSTESDNHDVMVLVIVVPIKCVREVERTSKAREDVGELTHCRVRQDLLEIHLDKGDGCCHHGGNTADNGDDVGQVCKVAVKRFCSEEWEHTSHEVQSGVNHGCCVNERRYWCWAFHSVWQPNVKWELSRLPNSTDEHEAKRPLEGASGVFCDMLDVCGIKHHSVIKRTEEVP